MSKDTRCEYSFRKTYDYLGLAIDDFHRRLAFSERTDGMVDLGIPGWLLPANALKLYEMAYFCPSDVLELGTFNGLSTRIILEGCRRSGRPFEIVTADHDNGILELARSQLVANVPNNGALHLFNVDVKQLVDGLADASRRFGLVFVDHSHTEASVAEVTKRMHEIVTEGGFVLFNDYNDPRNADFLNEDYGVFQAVEKHLSSEHFNFYGVFGSSGLFRRCLINN
ncbi:class I SAM-dependent methyltransferase [Methylobacterium sp. Leaf466]|uniref:class I SAM-dependent methyltransferase n=1 Tax=Methylobacterium sp. Leaf466 TaxID=1736386 RepID=UPI00138F6EC3|nr:class I SAM-dependent methyltransferase [Methylobacterium sp. Leaf466]